MGLQGDTSGGEILAANVGALRYYNDTGQTNGVKYYYSILARNAVGDSSNSTECWGIPTYPLQAQAVATERGVQLSWNDLSYITVYAIYRFTSPNDDYNLWSPVATTAQVRYLEVLNTGKNVFYYQVLGYNVDGDLVVISETEAVLFDPPASIDPMFFVMPGLAGAVVVVAYLVYRSKHSKPKLYHHGL